MNKKCVTCNEEFTTPGCRCQSCRDKSMPKKKALPSIIGKTLPVPLDPLILTAALMSKEN